MKGRCLWCYQDLPKSRTKPREFCGPSCKMAYARNVRAVFAKQGVGEFVERTVALVEAAIMGYPAERLKVLAYAVKDHRLFLEGSQAGEPDNSSVRDGRGTSPLATPITEG